MTLYLVQLVTKARQGVLHLKLWLSQHYADVKRNLGNSFGRSDDRFGIIGVHSIANDVI
ncbi:hypothetical protein SAG0142_02320 [Streptococcus agalactiae MRI Z1-024]|nr:hypothetical protein SAG0109_03520 [Streptococcus agalactiae BSU108]EPU29357.1 hypothetical protein SAG0139_09545 [Streptococcus agalactiae MRI Z1-012]EPW99282.1 hypothetical protein SAG0147_04585 [Streptococcus agalactiae MRI Z1-048]EQA29984.1 hypothetical protein SAG0142_02320 [Streptococcus agalactiae MRI Z1-024]